jgi:signal transduction histidine kinase
VGVVIVAAVIIDGPAEQPAPGLHGDRLGVLLALAAFAVGLLGELEQTRAAQVQAAALSERQHLAREMHDVLAHSLSALTLQLEGARPLAAAEQPDSGRIAAALERAHHLAQARLRDARRAIGTLRDEELPGPQRLTGLAHEFERDSGVSCHLEVAGERPELDSQARLAVYRTAQEALTNVRRARQRRAGRAAPGLRAPGHAPGRRGLHPERRPGGT